MNMIGGQGLIPSDYKPLQFYLEDLLHKKSVVREKALASIVKGLTLNFKLEQKFLQTHFATFLYRCLDSLKKNSVSAKEVHLASQAISLLSIIVDRQDNLHEICRELPPVLSKALRYGPKSLKVLECLAITTFFCSTCSKETEKTMQILWNFIESNNDCPSDVLLAAISAWLFLAASLDGWRFSYNYQGAVRYFLNLLESDEPSLSVVAGEGLALIFESRSLDKFCFKEETTSSTSVMYSDIEDLYKGVISEKLRLGLKKLIDQVVAYKTKSQFSRILDYFKTGSYLEICETIGTDTVILSSWSQMIQFNYLRSFLGLEGFYAHMKGNEKLREVFEFRPREISRPVQNLYVSIMEETIISCFLLKDRHLHLPEDQIKKRKKKINHAFVKAKTELRNKKRNFAEERKHIYLWNE